MLLVQAEGAHGPCDNFMDFVGSDLCMMMVTGTLGDIKGSPYLQWRASLKRIGNLLNKLIDQLYVILTIDQQYIN